MLLDGGYFENIYAQKLKRMNRLQEREQQEKDLQERAFQMS